MSKYFYLSGIVFFLATVSLQAQNKIKWNTWDEAIEKSKKVKKKIFVDIYTDWCGWCKKLDNTTFAENYIAKYINENYYPVKFNAEMKESVNLKGTEYKFVNNGRRGYHELAAYLMQGRLSYPTVVFLDEDLNLIQAIPGFQESDKLILAQIAIRQLHGAGLLASTRIRLTLANKNNSTYKLTP